MVGRADGGSFSIECFVSFEPLTSEDESLISTHGGMDNGSLHSTSDGHSGELKLQRAAHGHPRHRLFTAHLTYPPATRRRRSVGRAQNYYSCTSCAKSLARNAVVVGSLLGLGRSKQGAGRTACRCPIPNIPCPSIHRLLFFKFWSFAQRRGGRGRAFDEGMPTF